MIPSTSPSSSVYPIQDRKGRGFMVFISWVNLWYEDSWDSRQLWWAVCWNPSRIYLYVRNSCHPFPTSQGSSVSRLEDFHASAPSPCSKFIALLLSVLKTIGWGVSLIKLKSHPPTVVSLPSLSNGNPLHVQRHGSRALPGQIPQESLTLLSNDSNRESRCHLHCLINGRSVSSQ